MRGRIVARRVYRAVVAVLLTAVCLASSGCLGQHSPNRRKKPTVDPYQVTTELTEGDLGVRFYPLAGRVFSAGTTRRDGTGLKTVILTTLEPVDRVYEWYRKTLEPPLQTDFLSSNGTEPEAKLVKAHGADWVEVTVFRLREQTRIVLARHEGARPPQAKPPRDPALPPQPAEAPKEGTTP